MKIPLKIKSLDEFLDRYLSLVGALTLNPLTDIELLVLKEFITLPPKYQYARFSTPAKRRVLSSLREKNVSFSLSNLNNRIYALISKGFLRRDEDGVIYVAKNIINATSLYISSNKLDINITFVDESK